MSALEEEALRWLEYGRSDLEAAEELMGKADSYPRQVCFLAQQAAEKSLKAALVVSAIPVPRTHDLDALCNLLPDRWSVKTQYPELAALSI